MERTETSTSLNGGCICDTQLIQTRQNSFVRKTLTNAPKDFFAIEARNLELVASTDTFHTPKVLRVCNNALELEYIAHQQPNRQNWQHMGEQLAALHQIHQDQYGLDYNNFIGSIALNNHWQTDWPTFFAEQRLRPLLQQEGLTCDDRQRLSKLLTKIPEYLGNDEPASLLHGDLWAGNILFQKQAIFLIDPACLYGSRELEIAYLDFAGDLHTPLFEAYQANYPLSAGYEARKKLYMLYPYLFHLKLFGKSYQPMVRSILRYFT